MRAQVRMVFNGEEDLTQLPEQPSIDLFHDCIHVSIMEGVWESMRLNMFVHRKFVGPVLDEIYVNMGGQTVPYTLIVEGYGEEPGVCDISADALKKFFLDTADPKNIEMMLDHSCSKPEGCPVNDFREFFHLSRDSGD